MKCPHYDALGRLIERRTIGAVAETNRMYYAGWQMIAEYNGAGSLQRKYVYGPGIDEPVRMTVTASPLPLTYYFHCDGLGSVTEITGSTGQLVESYRYDVYGTPTFFDGNGVGRPSSVIGNRLLFTARDRDPDTTWYNYRHRYYNPTLGRFVQPDPIGLLGRDVNLYRYCLNDPIAHTDPDGKAFVQVVVYSAVGAAVLVGGKIIYDLYFTDTYAVTIPGTPITFYGPKYRKLSKVGRHVIQTHEVCHQRQRFLRNTEADEENAYRTQSAEALRIRQSGTFEGRPLTETEKAELGVLID